jgi:hypothetical protein
VNKKEILDLVLKIKSAGKSVGDVAKHGYGMAKGAAMANPKTTSALGGAAGMLALQKMFSGRASEDSDEQQKRMSMQAMYGM